MPVLLAIMKQREAGIDLRTRRERERERERERDRG